MAKKKQNNSFWEENKVNIIGWIVVLIVIVGGFGAASIYSNMQAQQRSDVLAIQEGDQVYGSEEAPNVLVEYSDFQCPFCAQYYPIVDELKANYADQVRIVYRHFPLQNAHPNAETAHVASLAAGRQDKFWEMHDLLFANQAEWSDDDNPTDTFLEYAEELELDIDKFTMDMADASLLDEVLEDKREGTSIGVNATPTFFLNGEALSLEDIAYDVDNIVSRFKSDSGTSANTDDNESNSSATSSSASTSSASSSSN